VNRTLTAPGLAALPTLRAAASPPAIAALFGFLVVALLAASDGGYWPTAWSWAALALSWLALLPLILRDRIRIGYAERAFVLLFAAFLAWILISLFWTSSLGRTVLEAERALAYVTAIFAGLLLVRTRAYHALLGGTWAAICLVSMYALATRLFPERLGVFDPIAGYRLSEPLGYWNALAIFAGIGSLLALGFAARSGSAVMRALGSASLLVLLPTVYFTFSRGAWIAVGVGLASAVAFDPRRLQLVTTALALAAAPALGLALAYRSDGLTHVTASLAAASREGHRLALALVALGVLNGLLAVGLKEAAERLSFSPAARRAYGAALVLVVLAALTAVFVRYGSPPTLAERAYDTLAKPTPSNSGDLNERLFTLSSRGRVLTWKAAWSDFEDNRLLGSGAGTYELYWAAHRSSPVKVRDAHSLYVETLAELGPIGLVFLAGGLLVPVAAAVRARMRSLVPAALGAYVAFLIHAGVDWDWEMTAVTTTTLLCGVALLVAGRLGSIGPLSLRVRVGLIVVGLALAAVAFVGAMGNQEVAAAGDAVRAGEWQEVEDHAKTAMTWMPWSSEPWQLAGEAQLARGQLDLARSTLRTAIDKDPDDWELWLDLSLASRGRERRQAAARAVRLNPLGRELAGLRKLLGLDESPQ
jgi:O-Antigen ligase/Tetratricopeptide repeat